MFKTILLAATALLVSSSAHAQKVGDVFYIALENHNFTQPSSVTGINQIFGNSAAPFINSLVTPGNANAAMVSYASNYVNVTPNTHPSEPNYVWMEAGTATNSFNKGNPALYNDNNPFTTYAGMPGANNIVAGPSLSAELQASGKTWRSYQEDTDLLNTSGQNINGAGGVITNTVAAKNQYEVPLTSFSGTSAAYTNPYNGSDQYNYAAKHNPQVFFTATNGGNDPTSANSQSQNYAPLQQLSGDLTNNTVANYNWITPDQFNDMHSALNTSFTYNGVTYAAGTDEEQIALGDNFLSKIVPLIEASQAFKNNGEIVIWNDETEGDDGAQSTDGFTSTEIIISPLAKGNAYTNNIQYSHSNDLATLAQIFGVGAPGAAAGANTMSDLFKPGAVPEPATWAMMITGFGLVGAALRRRVAKSAMAAA
jgi:phosphatidylinositol-3-phosphatase